MHAYHNYSDAQLVSLLIEGDQLAFEVIYKKYVQELYAYLRKNIPVQEDCEEIIQEVFESLWQRRAKLQHVTGQEGYLKGYLLQAVRYKVIRYFYKSKLKRKYADHFRLFEAVYSTSEDDKVDSATIQSFIDRGLASLPERCQLAVRLRLTENLSNGDIAKRMSITKGTVENYMVTAVTRLRSLYSEFYKIQ